ncbi:hypothetical protein QVD17_00710 [Tagetes erecta]|uniref:Uncharacterized protein n=1 Tax=Tagetes erecta TaxID=13708 RepID=A0AAD8P0T5_TARER|nr:hypothetical protein QVD17_00710 [Tagetes erecta]
MSDDQHRPAKLPPRVDGEIHNHLKANYPNPPDITNPDAATLRDQWKYAIRQYSKWYSHAWGTAILAGVSFFALGWVIKGGNPIPSFRQNDINHSSSSASASETEEMVKKKKIEEA